MSQAAHAIEWEIDDAAPTRLRWEQVRAVPSYLEATTHMRVDRAGMLAEMAAREPEETPIPLARRRDSAPTISDIRLAREEREAHDPFPPPEVTSSSGEITRVGPPPGSWVMEGARPPVFVPMPTTPTEPVPFRLLFIALVAFAFTLGMFLALTAKHLAAVLS